MGRAPAFLVAPHSYGARPSRSSGASWAKAVSETNLTWKASHLRRPLGSVSDLFQETGNPRWAQPGGGVWELAHGQAQCGVPSPLLREFSFPMQT